MDETAAMPEMPQMPQEPAAPEPLPLCRSDALIDGGVAYLFEVLLYGRQQSAFALRHDGVVLAYLNRCAHVPVEMDWQPGRFLDDTGRWLICSIHGAMYRPIDGLCVSGPCPGRRLDRLQVHEQGGQVWWTPSDRIRPAPPPRDDGR